MIDFVDQEKSELALLQQDQSFGGTRAKEKKVEIGLILHTESNQQHLKYMNL